MRNILAAGATALALTVSAAAFAQPAATTDGARSGAEQRQRGARLSAEDFQALTDARIAALRAGLKLSPDQDKNWPPLETALRDLAKQREQAMMRRREARERNERPDAIARLRSAADAMSARAAGLKSLADASEPLYRSLDDGQKRRLTLLTRQAMDGPCKGHRR